MTKLYEYNNTGDTTYSYLYGSSFGGQTFTVGNVSDNEDFTINSVKLKVYTPGSPGNMFVRIVGVDSSGNPDLFSKIYAYGIYDGNTITSDTNGEWIEITMTSEYDLIKSTQYAIVIDVRSATNSGDAIYWRRGSDVYTGGSWKHSSNRGYTWSSTTSDYMFEIWGTAVTIPPTLNNTNLFSASYDEIETFLKTISDPKKRFKVNWIHASMPLINARGFEGFPFMTLKVNVNEDEKSFDNSTSQKNFRAMITVYSNQPTDIESVCDSIFSSLKTSTDLTFGVRGMDASPINWTLDEKGKKILFRELTLELRSRI